MVQLTFDATQVAPSTGYEPVPEGWYNVAIDKSEMKPTKDKAGAFLELQAKVIDGPQLGKVIFIRLNLQNANQQAVEIAYGELSAICHVTGVYAVQDSSQLHGIPFQVRVTVSPAKDGYDASNNVKGYKDAQGNEPGKAGQGAAPTTQGGFGGQPAQNQGQPQGNPQGQGGWGGQPQQGGQNPNAGTAQGNPANTPATNGGFDPNAQQGNPQQVDPVQAQQNPAFDGGQATQPAQNPQQQPQGQGGGAPWGGTQPQQ